MKIPVLYCTVLYSTYSMCAFHNHLPFPTSPQRISHSIASIASAQHLGHGSVTRPPPSPRAALTYSSAATAAAMGAPSGSTRRRNSATASPKRGPGMVWPQVNAMVASGLLLLPLLPLLLVVEACRATESVGPTTAASAASMLASLGLSEEVGTAAAAAVAAAVALDSLLSPAVAAAVAIAFASTPRRSVSLASEG